MISQPGEVISGLLLMVVGGALYAMQAVAGIPLYLLLRRYRQDDLIAGFFTVLIQMTALMPFWSGLNLSFILRFLRPTAERALWGLPMGAIFWLIARPEVRRSGASRFMGETL
jgi:hypothetical protein